MTFEESIVAEARQWLGTPYAHQASCKGAGTDCLGLLRGIWRATVGAEPVVVPPYTADWSEAAGDEELWHAAKLWLVSKPTVLEAPGDILLFGRETNGLPREIVEECGVGDRNAVREAGRAA